MQLIEFSISGFRGIVNLHAEPNGKSVTLRGKNGAGKSSAVDALFWALGGALEGPVINNGADKAEVELRFGDYLITRRQTKGKTPTLTVKSADGASKFNSPTALLAGFREAIERNTFSHRKPAEQAAILRRLCPEIDTTILDAEYNARFAERTEVNRDVKSLAAQVAGIVVPDMPEAVPDDEDIAEIASKKADAERERAMNAEMRRLHQGNVNAVASCKRDVEKAKRELAEFEEHLASAEERLKTSTARVSSLRDPDTAEIDAEIAKAKATNAERGRKRRLADEARAVAQQKARMEAAHRLKIAEAEELTRQLETITQTKTTQLATARLPIEGLAINGDTVTLDQAEVGPVELPALNTAARIRLDVAIAAALGHKLVAVRDASLLDDPADLFAFAAKHGVQLIAEVVAKGEALSAEIVEGNQE